MRGFKGLNPYPQDIFKSKTSLYFECKNEKCPYLFKKTLDPLNFFFCDSLDCIRYCPLDFINMNKARLSLCLYIVNII